MRLNRMKVPIWRMGHVQRRASRRCAVSSGAAGYAMSGLFWRMQVDVAGVDPSVM
jgi:hypothetical protein